MSMSSQERDRRYSAMREMMRREGLGALLVYGSGDHFNVGSLRYITDYWSGGAEQYCFLPMEGEPLIVCGAPPGLPKFRRLGWIDRFSVVSNLKDGIEAELSRFTGGARIGVVGVEKGSPASYTISELPDHDRFIDATGIFRQLRLMKSPEEIEKIRRSAEIADTIFHGIEDMAKPGVSDFAIYGKVKQLAYDMGCEKSFDIIDTDGGKMNHSYPIGDTLISGCTVALEISPSYHGYYAQLPVTIPVGPYPPHLKEMVQVWEEALEAGVNSLRPGMRVCDVHRSMESVINGHGYAILTRSGHAIGLDLVDFFSVSSSEETVLSAGMTLVLHPSVQVPGDRAGDGIFMGYSYLINERGAEKLNRIDQIIR
jgi:Xaa-Pro aminopeptidase